MLLLLLLSVPWHCGWPRVGAIGKPLKKERKKKRKSSETRQTPYGSDATTRPSSRGNEATDPGGTKSYVGCHRMELCTDTCVGVGINCACTHGHMVVQYIAITCYTTTTTAMRVSCARFNHTMPRTLLHLLPPLIASLAHVCGLLISLCGALCVLAHTPHCAGEI